jgi:hypothetical protein
VDPAGRYLFFLTWESHSLYRLDLASGAPSLCFGPATLPDLQTMGTVRLKRHADEGRLCVVTQGHPWDHVFGQNGPVRMIILADPEDDGSFEAPRVLSAEEWTAREYNQSRSWITIATCE